MRHVLTIRRVFPWSDLGPFEGHVDVRLDHHELCLFITVAAERQWKTIPKDLLLDAEIWLTRTGTVRNLTMESTGELGLAMEQIHGTIYRMVGKISARCDDYLRLESVIPMTVDLDPGQYPDEVLPPLAVGDCIQVVGRLCVVLEPGDVHRFPPAVCT